MKMYLICYVFLQTDSISDVLDENVFDLLRIFTDRLCYIVEDTLTKQRTV